LGYIEARSSGKIDLLETKMDNRAILKGIDEGLNGKGRNEEVTLKATGKAVEKLLSVAMWFQGQDDVKVVLKTGSVGAVDDVVSMKEDGDEDGEVEETRVRRTSCLEVGVSLK
jgi:ribonuclease P/MRP protein subunit POP7